MCWIKNLFSKILNCTVILIIFNIIQISVCDQLKAQINNQISPQLMPPTPDASTLGSYGDVSVSKYTGKNQFAIPLYNISFDEISIPIDLFYNSGGVRVNEEAGSVGLSWNISSGTVITRQINGFDDISDVGADGFIYSYPVSSVHYSVHRDMLVDGYTGNYPLDIEPDLFNVNLFGKSITFKLEKKGAQNIIEATPLNNSNVKIRYNDDDQSIAITDDMGNQYIFADHELTTTYRGSSTDSESNALMETALQSVDSKRTLQKITSWYLTQIISSNKNIINFTYEKGFFYSYPTFSNSISIGVSSGQNPGIVSGVVSPPSYGCAVTGHESLNVKSIEGDFGKVEFNYSEDRQDLIDNSNYYHWPTGIIGIGNLRAKRLYQIKVKNSEEQEVKTIVFDNNDYFNANRISDTNKEKYLRLKLNGLSVNGRNYYFDYLASNSLPAKDTKDLDFWGFYNGKNNTKRIPSYARYVYDYTWNNTNIMYYSGADRTSDFNFAKNGILSKVIYPTGGSTSFIYEGNEALVEIPTDIETLNYNYSYLEGLPNIDIEDFDTQSISANQEFTISKKTAEAIGDYNLSLRVTVSCGYNCDRQRVYNPILRLTNSNGTYSQDIFSYSATSGSNTTLNTKLNLEPGAYSIQVLNYNSNPNNPETIGLAASLVNSYKIVYPTYTLANNVKEYQVGGLRTKEIRNYDENNTMLSRKTYKYTIERYGNTVSSGLLMDELVFHSKMGFFDYTPESYGNSITMASGNNLITSPSANGSHIGYSQVKEDYYESGNFNGSITSTFVNIPNNYTLRFIGTTSASNPSNPQYQGDATGHFADVTYGNVYVIGIPPATMEYKNGKLTSQFVLDNDAIIKKQSFYDYEDRTVENSGYLKILWQGAIGSSVPPETGGIVYNTNYTKSHRVSLNTVENTTINEDNGSFNEVINRSYNNSNYLSVETKETTNNGEIDKEEAIYYYPTDIDGYDELINNQIVGRPVKVLKKKDNQIVDGMVQGYSNFSINGYTIPKQTSKSIYNTQNEEFENNLAILDYSNNGKIVEFNTNDGLNNEITWGYNSMYPILKVVNGPENIASIINDALPSGYPNISNFIANMNNIENDASKQLLWTSFINDLRNSLPDHTLFEVFAHKPLVGITASGGSNKLTSFYTYDDLLRLKHIVDKDGNIIKQYDYNYAE